MWFFSIAAIGLYNIIRYDPSCFAALSPHYIYYYWKVGWLERGRVATGSYYVKACLLSRSHSTLQTCR